MPILESRRPKLHYVRFKGEEERCTFASFLGSFETGWLKVMEILNTRLHARSLVEWAKDKPEVVVLSADLTVPPKSTSSVTPIPSVSFQWAWPSRT